MARLSLILLAAAAVSAPAEVLEMAPTEQVARGEYLALHVAKCVECHSPHDREGNLEETKLFSGQAMPFQSPFPSGPKWAFRSPALKGLPGWSVEEFVHILTTGRRTNGRRANSPMPQFRFSRQDAAAIAAYLQSY